jgi:ATP-binding cassette subfamily C protein LapB
MLNVAPETTSGTPLQTFKAAFKSVAAFYGRPSSDTVLFSGLPDEVTESLDSDDVERMAERIGLQVITHRERDCRLGNFDCPAIVAFADGGVLPVLEVGEDGSYVTEIVPAAGNPIRLTRDEFVALKPQMAFAFTLYYQNASEEALVGNAVEIEKRHWLATTLAPYWRTYVRVMVAALFINLIALGSPLFTMNVYDRVLPNKAIPTLWVSRRRHHARLSLRFPPEDRAVVADRLCRPQGRPAPVADAVRQGAELDARFAPDVDGRICQPRHAV